MQKKIAVKKNQERRRFFNLIFSAERENCKSNILMRTQLLKFTMKQFF